MSTVKDFLSSDAIVGKNVAIVGGGLAGLSTTYHLLQKSPSLNITIFDKDRPGLGGASSVAGGLVHPLSPRGKLVHRGLEGLASTNRLVDAASSYEQGAVLRNEIWRIAISDEHVSTLKKTAADFPSFTEWFTSEELNNHISTQTNDVIKGALRLHGGCKVIHVPTYLAGLWKACSSLGSGTKEWRTIEIEIDDESWTRRLSSFDAVLFSSGAGMFQNSSNTALTDDLDERLVQLVLGQSCELKYPDDSITPRNYKTLLCGKYVSPLPDDRRLLVGATHEFKAPLSAEQVEIELKERTLFASEVWEDCSVDRVTSGIRVQSSRTGLGRLPILGYIKSSLHPNAWIYTGLSSRGLLYHGFYGEILSDMLLGRDIQDCPEVFWWKKGRKTGATL